MTFPCDNLPVDIFRPSERGNAARSQHFEIIFEEDLRQAFWIRFRIEDSSIFDDFMSKFRFELKFRWIQFSQKLHMISTLCHHFWREFDSSFLNQFHQSQKTSNQMTNLTSLPRFCHVRRQSDQSKSWQHFFIGRYLTNNFD